MRKKSLSVGWSSNKEMLEFHKFIHKSYVNGIPIVGRKFTWYILNGTSNSRLDRILVSSEWLEQWSRNDQCIINRVIYDHCALLLKVE